MASTLKAGSLEISTIPKGRKNLATDDNQGEMRGTRVLITGYVTASGPSGARFYVYAGAGEARPDSVWDVESSASALSKLRADGASRPSAEGSTSLNNYDRHRNAKARGGGRTGCPGERLKP